MATSHKHQHAVPASYLHAWADPATPLGHEPFVHVYSKDGSAHSRKPPWKLFREKDLYTLVDDKGGRDLTVEHALAELEGDFAHVRRDFLLPKVAPTAEAAATLFMFCAALHARTIKMRDHFQAQWQSVLDRMDEMKPSKATPEQRKAAVGLPSLSRIGRKDKDTLDHDQVRDIVQSTMKHMLPALLGPELSYLPRMKAQVLCIETDDVGFITSDIPVTWFDPEAYKKPPFYRVAALSSRNLEITMPISPTRLLLLTHPDKEVMSGARPLAPLKYVDISLDTLVEANRTIRFHCGDEFVVRRGHTHARWFQSDPLPPDAWEYTREALARDELANGE
jgi:hypothetical protein